MKLLLEKTDVGGYLPAPILSHFSQAALFLFPTLHQHVSLQAVSSRSPTIRGAFIIE